MSDIILHMVLNHLIQATVLRMRALRFEKLGNLPQFVQLVNISSGIHIWFPDLNPTLCLLPSTVCAF